MVQKTNPMAGLSMIHPCYLRERGRKRHRGRRRMIWYIEEIMWRDQRLRNKNRGWHEVKKKKKWCKEERGGGCWRPCGGGWRGEERSVIWTLCQNNRLAHWVKWYMTGTGPAPMHTRTITPPLWINYPVIHVCNHTSSPRLYLTNTHAHTQTHLHFCLWKDSRWHAFSRPLP